MVSNNMSMQTYSDKSFVVRGDTKTHSDVLKSLGGKWNSNLKVPDMASTTDEREPGWIFSNKRFESVTEFLGKSSLTPAKRSSEGDDSSPKRSRPFTRSHNSNLRSRSPSIERTLSVVRTGPFSGLFSASRAKKIFIGWFVLIVSLYACHYHTPTEFKVPASTDTVANFYTNSSVFEFINVLHPYAAAPVYDDLSLAM
jgi:hypothetical protein